MRKRERESGRKMSGEFIYGNLLFMFAQHYKKSMAQHDNLQVEGFIEVG